MTSLNRNYNEKRDFIRMKVDTPANIVIANDGKPIKGICRDLSGGGMLIELDSVLPIGTIAEISIASAHGHEPMLRVQAEVTRVVAEPDQEEKPCLLGLQIKKVLG